MILFQEDWAKHNATIHDDTNNKSFIRIAMVLKRMGIQNYQFPLSLMQPELARYNPHNLTDPSKELRMKIGLECSINPWYFFREVVRLPASGGDPIPIIANRAMLAMIWCFFNNISYIAIQPRQTGKAQPLYSKIKTPTGWTTMGDVQLGDAITVPDGTSASIIGIYPQGIKAIYRITFEDGRFADCCDEHLWKIYNRNLSPEFKHHSIISLQDIRYYLATHSHADLFIPLTLAETESTGKRYLGISSVAFIGHEQARCIEVDHPDHLYVTDNFIVTHNTIGACAIITWILYLGGRSMEMSLYTKDSELVQANVGRIKTMRESLPKYLILQQTSDTDNKEGLSYSKFNNKYRTAIAKPSRQDADNLGRGMTSPMIHIDEPGYCTNIDITYPIMMLSTIRAIANARDRGQPHSNILTTTASPIDTARGRYTFDMVNRAMSFSETLYDLKDKTEFKAIVKANSANDMINGTFSYLMLGLDHKWYEDACRISEASKEVNDRELLNMWTSGSETSIIDAADIKIMNAHRFEPDHVEIIQNYAVKWYVPESVRKSTQFHQHHYILGMDGSESIGEDFTTLVMINVSDMSVVCTFRCNESNIIKLGMFIAEFLISYPTVTFIPESNSTGRSIIDVIALIFQKHRINPYRRIYNEIVQKRDDPAMARISLDDPDLTDTSLKKYLGFRTTAKTRPFLYKNTLKKAVSLNATRIKDINLVAELSALSVVNGRIDHSENGHDDMCFIGSTLVRTDKGNRPISELKIGDLVLTRQGYKPILHIFKSEKEVISKFGFTGTENHPFITPIDGIVEFKDLTPETRVYTWNEKQSVITEKTITDILNQTDHNSETIITDTIKTKVHPWHFIGRYMRMLKDLFQKSRTFIIRTKTISTTPSKISNVSRRLSILRNILPLKRHEGSLLNFREKEIHWGCGVENIQKNPAPYVLQTEFVEQENLLPNGESLTQSLHTKQRFVQEAAQNESNHKAVVYNLYIADCHEYFANDVLVHNCIAYLLSCWLLFFGENLHHYGLDVRSILMSITADGSVIDPTHRDQQLDIRRQIKQYEDLIGNTPSPLLKNTYRQRILLLQDRLDHGITIEPVASAKINQDVSEYGKTLYTPQEFARSDKTRNDTDDLYRRVIKLLH
jgi:hypothetical protein